MNIPKVLAVVIFTLLGVLIFIKGIQITRSRGIGDGFIEILSGIGFVIIGALIAVGYIN